MINSKITEERVVEERKDNKDTSRVKDINKTKTEDKREGKSSTFPSSCRLFGQNEGRPLSTKVFCRDINSGSLGI